MPDIQVSVSSSYSAPCERGKNSYQEEKSASCAVDEDRVVRGGGDQLARTEARMASRTSSASTISSRSSTCCAESRFLAAPCSSAAVW